MREHFRKPNMGGLLALLLLGVFAICILSVLLMGADAYQRLVDRDLGSYDRRTAAQYVSARVRQGDRLDGVSVRALDGGDATASPSCRAWQHRAHPHHDCRPRRRRWRR